MKNIYSPMHFTSESNLISMCCSGLGPTCFCCHSVAKCVRLFVTPWTAVCQASLSFTISWSLLKLMSVESVMASKHFVLCGPLLLLPSIFPTTRVFSNESALHIRWPKYWSFSFSIGPSNEYSGLISFSPSEEMKVQRSQGSSVRGLRD